ncbi:CoA transferase [Rhodococcus sp. ZPP]|uniref:CaiB/BaiF CoA transferase family protein n=1 Tax=Rhodococcus sp. ZPP TaxID=2749906 RepID=UPI001AD89C09|nr:CoA transferase [Rhodococcus sp. ZPP]QTJ68361.1 CoA transferase [Rhodococcus sp. ZPP]
MVVNAAHAESKLSGPLDGVRVVEVGVWHAGPAVGAILADLGADVIKVESLQGDPERHFAAFAPMTDTRNIDADGWTVMFELSNRGKRGVSLDLESAAAHGVLERLVEGADIFVTNLRGPTRRALGIDYEALSAINPTIIHVNVTGFGGDGPLADAGAFDNVGQAMSGMMFTAGGDNPQPLNVMVMDHLTAIVGSHAAITALAARELHGIGQEVHTSLYGAGTWLMYGNLGFTGARGHEVSMNGDRLSRSPLRNLYKCSDGKWVMGTNHPEQEHWSNFCQVLGCAELVNDPRFHDVDSRNANLKLLYQILDEAFQTKPRETWLDELRSAGLFFAPVHSFTDVLNDEQALANGYVDDVDHRHLGTVRQPSYPIRFGAFNAGPTGPAPWLGEHSREILASVGYSDAEIEALIEAGAVNNAGEHR